jgi:hypothetical protein
MYLRIGGGWAKREGRAQRCRIGRAMGLGGEPPVHQFARAQVPGLPAVWPHPALPSVRPLSVSIVCLSSVTYTDINILAS